MKPSACIYPILIAIALAGQGSTLFAERTAKMLYFKAPKDAPESAVIYLAGSKPLEVVLERNNFSSTFKLPDGEVLLHFLGSPLAEGEEFPQGAPSVKVPATYGKILILASPDPKNPIFPVSFKVINANSGTFGEGDRMFINFTDSYIVGQVGKEKLVLKPNSTAVVKNAGKPAEEYQVSLDKIDPVQRKPFTFIRQTWRQSATQRSLIFIFSPPGSSGITYYNAPVSDL